LNVLDGNLSAVSEAYIDPVADTLVDDGGDAHAARLGQRLQARSDINSVAIDVVALNHHVAQIKLDAQDDPSILGQVSIGRFHGLLQLDSTFDSVYCAGELDEDFVAHQLDDAASMFW
jgi:hypothetical protein